MSDSEDDLEFVTWKLYGLTERDEFLEGVEKMANNIWKIGIRKTTIAKKKVTTITRAFLKKHVNFKKSNLSNAEVTAAVNNFYSALSNEHFFTEKLQPFEDTRHLILNIIDTELLSFEAVDDQSDRKIKKKKIVDGSDIRIKQEGGSDADVIYEFLTWKLYGVDGYDTFYNDVEQFAKDIWKIGVNTTSNAKKKFNTLAYAFLNKNFNFKTSNMEFEDVETAVKNLFSSLDALNLFTRHSRPFLENRVNIMKSIDIDLLSIGKFHSSENMDKTVDLTEDRQLEFPEFRAWQMYGRGINYDVFKKSVLDFAHAVLSLNLNAVAIKSIALKWIKKTIKINKTDDDVLNLSASEFYDSLLDSDKIERFFGYSFQLSSIKGGDKKTIFSTNRERMTLYYILNQIDDVLFSRIFDLFCKHPPPGQSSCNEDKYEFSYGEKCCEPPRQEYFRNLLLDPSSDTYEHSKREAYNTPLQPVDLSWLKHHSFDMPHQVSANSINKLITAKPRDDGSSNRRFLLQSVATRLRRRYHVNAKDDLQKFKKYLMEHNDPKVVGNKINASTRPNNRIVLNMIKLIDYLVFDNTFMKYIDSLNDYLKLNNDKVILTGYAVADPTADIQGYITQQQIQIFSGKNYYNTIVLNIDNILNSKSVSYPDKGISSLRRKDFYKFLANQTFMEIAYVITHEMAHFIQYWSGFSSCAHKIKDPPVNVDCVSGVHGKTGHCQHFMQAHDTFCGHDELHCSRYDHDCKERSKRKFVTDAMADKAMKKLNKVQMEFQDIDKNVRYHYNSKPDGDPDDIIFPNADANGLRQRLVNDSIILPADGDEAASYI